MQKYPFEKIANGPAPKLVLITNAFQLKQSKVGHGTRELIFNRATEKENKNTILLSIQRFMNEDQLMQKPFKFIDKNHETLGDNEKCEKRDAKWYEDNIERVKSMPGNEFLLIPEMELEQKSFEFTDNSSKFQLWTLSTWFQDGIITPVMLQELRSRILELSLDELIVCSANSKDRTGVVLCSFLALDVVPVIVKEYKSLQWGFDTEQQLENLTDKIANFLLHTIRLHFSDQMCVDWAKNGLKELIRLDILNCHGTPEYTPFYEWEGGDLKKLYADYVAYHYQFSRV